MTPTVLKHGIGYDLVVVQEHLPRTRDQPHRERLVLAIRCQRCQAISFNPNDVRERYCGACHVFHEEGLLSHEG
jgi:hypothetical protein